MCVLCQFVLQWLSLNACVGWGLPPQTTGNHFTVCYPLTSSGWLFFGKPRGEKQNETKQNTFITFVMLVRKDEKKLESLAWETRGSGSRQLCGYIVTTQF